MKKVIISFLVLCLCFAVVNPFVAQGQGLSGNTNANLANKGYVTQDKDWYYFNNDEGLTKIRKNGKDKTILIKKPSIRMDLNVVGNYLFFYEADGTVPSGKSGIFRYDLKNNTVKQMANQNANSPYVVGNTIYYKAATDTNLKNDSIYTMDLNGNNKKKLTGTVQRFNFTVDSQYFYYQVNDGFYRRTLDNKNATKVTSTIVDNPIVDKGIIYYINKKDGSKLYKMSNTGKNNVRLTTKAVEKFTVTDTGKIVYTTSSSSPLYVMTTNGWYSKVLVNVKQVDEIYMLGDQLVYGTFDYPKQRVNYYKSTYKNSVVSKGTLLFKTYYN